VSAPSITIFVRHSAVCSNRLEEEFFKRCNCRKHLRWFHNGSQHRQSAKTRSWSQAEVERRKLEACFGEVGTPTIAPARTTIEQAIQTFIESKRNQGWASGVIKKYERELPRLEAFLTKRSKFFPSEIELRDLEAFRTTWEEWYPSSATRQNVQARLRGFLRYCLEARWIDRVPKLSSIKVNEVPTMPLSDDEYAKLLQQVATEFQDSGKASKVHALIQLMKHSGLAITDSIMLERGKIEHDAKCYRIVTSRQKTGVHVSVPIPDDVAKEILAVLNGNPRYVFWGTGNGKVQTAVTNWQHDLRKLFRATFGKKTDFTPHCLRDTFAVDLLRKGVPLEEVSKLLGHKSIKTTEESYAKWVQSRQNRLDDLVIGTWKEKLA
jgi:integrase/recombinase XerD